MLELDLLLRDFLNSGYASLDDAQRRCFDHILDYPDAVLLEWFMGRVRPVDKDVANLVDAPVAGGVDVIGIQLQCPVVGLQCRFQLATACQCIAPVVVGLCTAGAAKDRRCLAEFTCQE